MSPKLPPRLDVDRSWSSPSAITGAALISGGYRRVLQRACGSRGIWAVGSGLTTLVSFPGDSCVEMVQLRARGQRGQDLAGLTVEGLGAAGAAGTPPLNWAAMDCRPLQTLGQRGGACGIARAPGSARTYAAIKNRGLKLYRRMNAEGTGGGGR